MNDPRLSRMEDKLDKLSEAVISMARMEERLVSVFKRLDRVDEGFNKSDQRMDELEQTSIKRGQTIAFAERLFWIILTGAVGLVFVYLRRLNSLELKS
jgi:hypothetical protein